MTQPSDFGSPEPQYGFTPCPGCAPGPTTPAPQGNAGPAEYGSPSAVPANEAAGYGSPSSNPIQETPRDVDSGLFTPISAPGDYSPQSEQDFTPVEGGSLAPAPVSDIESPALAPAYDPLSSSAIELEESYASALGNESPGNRPTSNRANDVSNAIPLSDEGVSVDIAVENNIPNLAPSSENERPLADPMDLEAYTASQDSSAKTFDKQAVAPPASPLNEDGVTVNIAVENNLPNLPGASDNQVRQPQARQVLPSYNIDTSNGLPTYNNNPTNVLPTYNPTNTRPTFNNNPLPLPYNPQGVYDPFIFQERNKPEETVKPEEPAPLPVQPEAPVQPTRPAQPQIPVRPQRPVQPSRPAQPQLPVLPQSPVQSQDPVQPGVTSGSDVNNDVELVNIPDFSAPVNANQQLNSGNSFSFTQFGNNPSFGFGNNQNSIGFGNSEEVNNNLNSVEQSGSLNNQDPELFNPFGVSFASGFSASTTRRTTQRSTTRATTTTTTTTTTQRTTTRRTTRRPQQNFQQQNQSPGGFNFNVEVNNRPLPPTFAPGLTTLTFKPFGSPEPNEFGLSSLVGFGGTPQPGRPVFSLGFQTSPKPAGLQFSTPNSIFSTSQPSFFASTTPSTFFGSTITPQQFRPSTTRTTTTPTTTRRTTRRPVLSNQFLPQTENIANGFGLGISSLNLGTSSAFGRPANLQLGSLDEITGNSGIYFSTPATTFVTPEDFGTPAPNRNRQQSSTTTTKPSIEETNANQIFSTKRPNSFNSNQIFSTIRPNTGNRFNSNQILSTPSTINGNGFNSNQVVTTSSPPFNNPRTTTRPRRPTPVVSLVVPGLIGESKPTFGSSNLAVRTSTTFGGTLRPFGGFGGTPQPLRNFPFSGTVQPNLKQQLRRDSSTSQVSPNFIPSSNSLRPQSTDRFIDTAETSTEVAPRSHRDPKSAELEGTGVAAFSRRNMLMNIILRPGGGEQAKALPRPKVEVSSEGSNVILVRLTFPENENIHGLRAFTPTDPVELQKFDELSENIQAGAKVERLYAVSSEESDEDDFVESRTIREKLSAAKPTRPTRPPKKSFKPSTISSSYLPPPEFVPPITKPSRSYLPPPGAPAPVTKPSLSYLPPPGAKSPSNQVNTFALPKVNKLQRQQHGPNSFFKVRPTSEEESQHIKRSKIKPRRTHGPPPPAPERPRYFYPIIESFHPREAMKGQFARHSEGIVEEFSAEQPSSSLSQEKILKNNAYAIYDISIARA